jgi:hypothetical protein
MRRDKTADTNNYLTHVAYLVFFGKLDVHMSRRRCCPRVVKAHSSPRLQCDYSRWTEFVPGRRGSWTQDLEYWLIRLPAGERAGGGEGAARRAGPC